MENNKIAISVEQQFGEVIDIILQHKSRASKAVNEELLQTAWHVGGYVSAKLKSEEWGSKVVTQLSEYIRSQRPDIKGFGRSSIYNMVLFYDEYSSAEIPELRICPAKNWTNRDITFRAIFRTRNNSASKNYTNRPARNWTYAEDTGIDNIDQPY